MYHTGTNEKGHRARKKAAAIPKNAYLSLHGVLCVQNRVNHAKKRGVQSSVASNKLLVSLALGVLRGAGPWGGSIGVHVAKSDDSIAHEHRPKGEQDTRTTLVRQYAVHKIPHIFRGCVPCSPSVASGRPCGFRGGAALESGAVLWSLGGIKYAERKFGLAYRENLEA